MSVPFEINQRVEGTVTRFTPFGVFVELVEAPTYSAILHISELPIIESKVYPIPDMFDMFKTGEHRDDFRVVGIDDKRRRIRLSLRPFVEQSESE